MLTSIFAGAFVKFYEIELAIFLDFKDLVFNLKRIGRKDRSGMNIKDNIHLIEMFFGGT